MTDFSLSFTDDKRTDREGRRQFFLDWVCSRGRRGQCFFANPVEVVYGLWRNDHSVYVVDPDLSFRL